MSGAKRLRGQIDCYAMRLPNRRWHEPKREHDNPRMINQESKSFVERSDAQRANHRSSLNHLQESHQPEAEK